MIQMLQAKRPVVLQNAVIGAVHRSWCRCEFPIPVHFFAANVPRSGAAGCYLVLPTNCIVPQQLEPADGQAGGADEYSCGFTAIVDCSSHTNTVKGGVTDNDGSAPLMPEGSATVTLQGAAECPPAAK